MARLSMPLDGFSQPVLICVYAPPLRKGGATLGKIVDCAKVDPSTGCSHVVRGDTEEELMRNAAEHARQHGIVEVTPELMERVRANIQDE